MAKDFLRDDFDAAVDSKVADDDWDPVLWLRAFRSMHVLERDTGISLQTRGGKRMGHKRPSGFRVLGTPAFEAIKRCRQ